MSELLRPMAPLTLGQALRQARCPQCGAEPGNDCKDGTPLPEGKHRVHTARLYGVPIPQSEAEA